MVGDIQPPALLPYKRLETWLFAKNESDMRPRLDTKNHSRQTVINFPHMREIPRDQVLFSIIVPYG